VSPQALLEHATTLQNRLDEVTAERDQLAFEHQRLASEREKFRELYLQTLAKCLLLEKGLLGQKRERWTDDERQLTIDVLGALLATEPEVQEEETDTPPASEAEPKRRPRPVGRQRPPETLPRVEVEIIPPDVQEDGLAAFQRIGEDVSEEIERRTASVVVVRVIRPKFVRKASAVPVAEVSPEVTQIAPVTESQPMPARRTVVGASSIVETQGSQVVLQASAPELPIPRGLAGPGMLADTVVKRWLDHLPLNRLESVYAREGLPLSRSTICAWHLQLGDLVQPLIEAMWADARGQPYLCTDATGVLVQSKDKCRHAHFFVVIAPGRHVLFNYSRKHDGKAVDAMLRDYRGYLVADASSVYDHLYGTGDVAEVGCWAHLRRYYFKALASEPEWAREALSMVGTLFKIERELEKETPEKRLHVRQHQSKPLVERFFAWCDTKVKEVLEDTPIAKAIGYSQNHRGAFERYLEDGRLPIHNNWSERELRREAVGRKNWLFVGSDDGGTTNASFVTLLASCQHHGLEPYAYLRDLFCLLPSWPKSRVLELSPAEWTATSAKADVQAKLGDNIFRTVTLSEP
jgi:transposase